MVEPGLVQTGMSDGIDRTVEAEGDNQSVDDLDRRCAREFLRKMRAIPQLAATDVVAKLLEIIEAEKPVLRYPIPEDAFRESFLDLMSDMTGEKSVAQQQQEAFITENV